MAAATIPDSWRKSFVLLLSGIAGIIAYFPFEGFSCAIYVAFCVGYSVIVFGWSLVDPRSRLGSRHDRRPLKLIALVHAGYLAALCGLIFVEDRVRLYMPTWMVEKDRKGGSLYVLLCIVVLLCLEGAEERWLSSPKLSRRSLENRNQ